MSDPRLVAPEADELEVSIFGPGFGECIVVHVPNGPWFVVDSFRLKDRTPVAVQYLRDLNVSDVDSLTISHWHRDHTGGAAEVIAAFPSLRLVVLPGAVGEREFSSFVSGMVAGTFAAHMRRQVEDIESVLETLRTRPLVQAAMASPNLDVSPRGATWSLRALSPSVDDVRADLGTLSRMSLGYSGPKPKAFDVNSGCTVLCLEVAGSRVLLSSDLDVGSGPTRGWHAIVQHFPWALDASVVKVGHHGSRTAFHPPAWATRPAVRFAAITPYPARGGRLPRADMLRVHGGQVDRLFVSAKHRKGSRRAGAVPLNATPFTTYTTTTIGALGDTGQVRFRVARDGTRTVRLFGGAREHV